jgi:hypothetical protein
VDGRSEKWAAMAIEKRKTEKGRCFRKMGTDCSVHWSAVVVV